MYFSRWKYVILNLPNVTFTQLQNFFQTPTSKTRLSSYLDHLVRTRASKFTYGSFCANPYDPSASHHRSLSHNVFTAVSNLKADIILPDLPKVS